MSKYKMNMPYLCYQYVWDNPSNRSRKMREDPLDPRGQIASRKGLRTRFLRTHIATCDFQRGCPDPFSPLWIRPRSISMKRVNSVYSLPCDMKVDGLNPVPDSEKKKKILA